MSVSDTGVEGPLSRFHISNVSHETSSMKDGERQDTLTEDTVDGAGMAKPCHEEEEEEYNQTEVSE